MTTHGSAKTNVYQRRLLVRRVRQQGWTQRRSAKAAGVSVRTVAKWLARAPQELADRSSRPHHQPGRVAATIEEAIVALRGTRATAWQISVALAVPRSTVTRVLARQGLNRLPVGEPAPPRPLRGLRVSPRRHRRCDAPGLCRCARRPGWSGVRGVSAPRGALVWPRRHPDPPAPHRQRLCLSRAVFRAGVSAVGDPPPLHAALSAADQRESRALHPDPAPRVGVSHALPQLDPAHHGTPPLSPFP